MFLEIESAESFCDHVACGLRSSNQFQKGSKPCSTRYFVALKLNHGSNSWMILSNRMTEKRRDDMAAPAIVSKMIALRRVRVFLAASPWNRASMMTVGGGREAFQCSVYPSSFPARIKVSNWVRVGFGSRSSRSSHEDTQC